MKAIGRIEPKHPIFGNFDAVKNWLVLIPRVQIFGLMCPVVNQWCLIVLLCATIMKYFSLQLFSEYWYIYLIPSVSPFFLHWSNKDCQSFITDLNLPII